MAISLSENAKKLIDRPNFAHLATLMPDGSPQSVPVWIARQGEHIVVCTGEGSLKGKNTRRDPRLARPSWILTIPLKKCRFAAV